MQRARRVQAAFVLSAIALAAMGADTQCEGVAPDMRPSVAGFEARLAALEATVAGLGAATWFSPGVDIVDITTEFPVFTTVEEFELEPGSYVVTARADLLLRSEEVFPLIENPLAFCRLVEGNVARDLTTVFGSAVGQVFGNELRVPITLTAGVEIADPEVERIGIRCAKNKEFGTVDARGAALVAIELQDLTTVAP